MYGRDTIAMAKNALLEQVLHLLVKVEVLKVVNDANVVDVATAATEEFVARALKLFLEQG